MRPAARVAGIIILLIVLFLPVGLYYAGQQKVRVSAPAPQPPTAQKIPSVNSNPSFTPNGYIQPLGKQSGEGDLSDRAYVRGVVKTWKSKELVLQIGTKEQSIQLPKEVQLRCFDKYITNSKGEKKKTSDAWLDVNNKVLMECNAPAITATRSRVRSEAD